MLSLGGERVLKFSELQLNDTPHTAYGFGGLKQGVRVCEKQLIFISILIFYNIMSAPEVHMFD
jgi:hypothetical protein